MGAIHAIFPPATPFRRGMALFFEPECALCQRSLGFPRDPPPLRLLSPGAGFRLALGRGGGPLYSFCLLGPGAGLRLALGTRSFRLLRPGAGFSLAFGNDKGFDDRFAYLVLAPALGWP